MVAMDLTWQILRLFNTDSKQDGPWDGRCVYSVYQVLEVYSMRARTEDAWEHNMNVCQSAKVGGWPRSIGDLRPIQTTLIHIHQCSLEFPGFENSVKKIHEEPTKGLVLASRTAIVDTQSFAQSSRTRYPTYGAIYPPLTTVFHYPCWPTDYTW